MKTLTSYTLVRGQDGTQAKVINWQESAPNIWFMQNEVRFYGVGEHHVTSHYKVYIPKVGEHLEITGD